MIKKRLGKKTKKLLAFSVLVFILFLYFAIPVKEKELPFSTVINDRKGNLLSASIAKDGQWRFPVADSIPHKFETCLLLFEDEYFYSHPGINPISIIRAIKQNLKAGKIISGASTITMQVARMQERKGRTVFQKIKEIGIALRLELQMSKENILNIYASLAPFGGNVVGINAASWRYYGRPAHLLTWAESAALAVLPNQPGAIYPGTGQEVLQRKRDFLLHKIFSRGILDTLDYQLSLAEPLPGKPFDIPQKAPHLLTTIREKYEGKQVLTSLDPFWQNRMMEVIERKHRVLEGNGVENLAAMALDLESGQVIAYVGNTSDIYADGYSVDVIQRPRSSGSILKPFLYSGAISDGLILPNTLLQDIPTFFGGYTPKNFSYGYEGMIPANQALSKSLNIPFTYLLRDYGYEKFYQNLQDLGVSTLTEPPIHYGLTMILGGAEVKLWDLAQGYFSMYRKLANEDNLQISYDFNTSKKRDIELEEISIWHTFQAMTDLKRPGADQHWQSFNSSQVLAWKTGTSFGFRDAWAVGLNGDVLIAVWVGNADGEGRAGLIGSSTAGPMLMELMRLSNHDSNWLKKLSPFSKTYNICVKSGMLVNGYCPEFKTIILGKNAEKSGLCIYHQQVWVDESESYLVNKDCYPTSLIKSKTVFVLPTTEGYYFRQTHSDYDGKLPMISGCEAEQLSVIAINYPKTGSKVFIPRELNGKIGQVVLEASHQSQETIHWHLNDDYLGETKGEHKQSVELGKGLYNLKVIDGLGNSTNSEFEVISDSPQP